MRTSNPALKKAFQQTTLHGSSEVMTIEGTITKSGILLLLVTLSAMINWSLFAAGSSLVQPLVMTGAIGGFIVALITIFKKESAHITAPIYALLEGLFLGGISALFELAAPGIVMQAIMLTFGVFAVMLVAYRAGWIRATAKFRAGMLIATGAVALTYMVSFALSFFGMAIPMIHEGGTVGIIFSVVVVAIAALNLILDFDLIEEGAAQGAPKYMEWYASFGLLVTLVWLYLEILRLLSKLSRD